MAICTRCHTVPWEKLELGANKKWVQIRSCFNYGYYAVQEEIKTLFTVKDYVVAHNFYSVDSGFYDWPFLLGLRLS